MTKTKGGRTDVKNFLLHIIKLASINAKKAENSVDWYVDDLFHIMSAKGGIIDRVRQDEREREIEVVE
jgi:hypothetical protein